MKGEIPSEKIYEDEKVFAFLDIPLKSEGHTILIPKIHFENIFTGKEEELSGIREALKKISNILKEKYGFDGVNLINNSGKTAGQEVNHFYFHIISRYLSENIEEPEKKAISEDAFI